MSTPPLPPHPDSPPGPTRPSRIQAELRQRRPFRTARQEATVALLRTASVVRRALERVVEPAELSLAQYNALRIVRGAGSAGIPTLAIRERMIEEGTTITRLLDKLEAAGLIGRERALPDRRQVICVATDAGKVLLDRLDPLVDAADAAAVETLADGDVETLVRLLDAVRAANADRGAARSAAPAAAGRRGD
jgi:MarR family transcriptional regulator, organic hydroperoxide resistance regulator